MARSSEDVLLVVKNVRNKKTDGSLYMMSERLAWMQNSKESFSLSYMYSDIKLQKISPDTKDKVQLQLVFYDGGANTFHFTNPAGRVSQLSDRDSIKEILQQLLPKFRRKISSELEQKNRLLKRDPDLFALYKDLVVSQVITAEEFWANHAEKLRDVGQDDDKINRVGISAAFLADIKPQTDGCNGLKYNLTSDVIDSIFRTYPMVKQKHHEFVPHQMTESEFWTRFFQSHYFHRDRVNTGNKDLFTECAEKDDEVMQEEITKHVDDRLLDLTANMDSSESYGAAKGATTSSSLSINTNLIRRFNHHSTMILRTCQTARLSSPCTVTSKRSSGNGVITNGDCESATDSSRSKKTKLLEKLQYDDLETDSTRHRSALSLSNTDRYLHGPTPLTPMTYAMSGDLLRSSKVSVEQMDAWKPTHFTGVSSNLAVSILGELSPGGALMITDNRQSKQILPDDIQSEIRHLYHALSELLRHFWSCFPTSSRSLEEKVMKMKATLERFETAKIHRLKEKLLHQHYSTDLVSHMDEMLRTAYTKFSSWQTRRSSHS